MKHITDFIINESNQSLINVSALEESLQTLVGKTLDVKISDIVLPAQYFNSGLVGTIIEYYICQELKSVDITDENGQSKVMKFSVGESEDSIVYGHPDFQLDNILIEIKANRNIKKDGIKFTDEQMKKLNPSTPIIWVGYSIDGSSIKIDEIKVREFKDFGSKKRVYSI